MFCTRCGSDLGDRGGVCPKCGKGDRELVTVCRTGDAALLPLLKSVLDGAGIPYVVQGEEALGLFPLGPFAGGMLGGQPAAASILVARERAEEAERLLEGAGEAES